MIYLKQKGISVTIKLKPVDKHDNWEINLVNLVQKNPYLNQATQKDTCHIFPPKKIPESKISNPTK